MFFSAIQPVALVRITGTVFKALRLLAPASVERLGFSDAEHGADCPAHWFVQPTAEGHWICLYASTRQMANATLLAAVTFERHTRSKGSPLSLAWRAVDTCTSRTLKILSRTCPA